MKKFIIVTFLILSGCYEQTTDTMDNPNIPDEYSDIVYISNEDLPDELEATGSIKLPYPNLCDAVKHFSDISKFPSGTEKTIIFKDGEYSYSPDNQNSDCWNFANIDNVLVTGETEAGVEITVNFENRDSYFSNLVGKNIVFKNLKFIVEVTPNDIYTTITRTFFMVSASSVVTFENLNIVLNYNTNFTSNFYFFNFVGNDPSVIFNDLTLTINNHASIINNFRIFNNEASNANITLTSSSITTNYNNTATTNSYLFYIAGNNTKFACDDLTLDVNVNSSLIFPNTPVFYFSGDNSTINLSQLNINVNDLRTNGYDTSMSLLEISNFNKSTFNFNYLENQISSITNANPNLLTIYNNLIISDTSTLKLNNITSKDTIFVIKSLNGKNSVELSNNNFNSESESLKINYSGEDIVSIKNNYLKQDIIELQFFYNVLFKNPTISILDNSFEGQLILSSDSNNGVISSPDDYIPNITLSNNYIFNDVTYATTYEAFKHELTIKELSVPKLVQINCPLPYNNNKFCNKEVAITSLEECITSTPSPQYFWQKIYTQTDFSCGNYTFYNTGW